MPSPKKASMENEKERCLHHDDFAKKILFTLVGVLLVYLTFYVGTLMRNNMKKYDHIGQADTMERTITVTGYGRVSGQNDIAVTSIGYSTLDKDVAKAQAENAKVMNKVMADLKTLGIAEKDLQSTYSIQPENEYTEKGKDFKGYRVASAVAVKVRDLSKISAVLALPGKHGANEVSGLSFTIDDPENLKTVARAKALQDAEQKAAKLSTALRVRIGEVISYNDYEAPDYQPMYAYKAEAMSATPDIASGTKDTAINVSITYKVYSRR